MKFVASLFASSGCCDIGKVEPDIRKHAPAHLAKQKVPRLNGTYNEILFHRAKSASH